MADRVRSLRDRLADGLCSIEGVRWTVEPGSPDGEVRLLPGVLHLLVDDVDSEPLLFLLDRDGVRASASSACASGAAAPSHVLAAVLGDHDLARQRGALRLSLGHDATDAEVDLALRVVPAAIAHLRGADPRGSRLGAPTSPPATAASGGR